MPTQLIPFAEVKARVTLSKAQIWRLIGDGTFPRPVKLGPHRSAWVSAEVEDWIQARISEREAVS